MHTINADVPLHRRKRIHVIMDEHDTVQWTGSGIVAAIEYLVDNGYNECKLEGQEAKFVVSFFKAPD